jgi:transcriptional regulator with XRE-family HTH domain
VESLGKTIRILRQAKALKLGALATAANVSSPFLSLVESGDRQPSLDVLRKIARGLGIPSEVLILMSVGSESDLKSTDPETQDLSESVDRLIRLEVQLQEKLARLRDKDGCKKSKPG